MSGGGEKVVRESRHDRGRDRGGGGTAVVKLGWTRKGLSRVEQW